ncbi:MAG: zinc ribbon domain-containing protein [Ignavibacteriales bacterium]
MLEKIKKCCSLTNILKFIGILIVVLFVSGMLVGFMNIQQAKKERKDIANINAILEIKGLTNEAKTAISSFMKNYPRTKNIIICDDKGSIIYKANDKIIKGRNTFNLSKDEQHPSMFSMDRGQQRFMPMPEREFFSLIPSANSGANKGKDNNFNRRDFKDKFNDGRKGNPDFINTFDIPGKGMKINYISGRFEENNMIDMFFISHQILRLLILIFWVLLAVWVYEDSKKRGLQQIFWGIVTLFTGLAGLIIYLLVRHRLHFCNECKVKVDEQSSFCQECGSILKTKCSECGSMMNLNWNYCTTCGKKKE